MKKVKIQVLNFKLFPKKRKGAKVYGELFQDIFKKRIIGNITTDRKGMIKKLIKHNDHVFYGTISTFIHISENDDWLNTEKLETEHEKYIPDNRYPKEKTVEYFLDTQLHKLFLLAKSKTVNINQVEKLLKSIFKKYLGDDETMNIEKMVKKEIIDLILNNPLYKLSVSITPTNDESLEAFEDFLDKDLKQSGTSKFDAEFKAPSNKSTMKDSKFASALVKLAQNNGKAKAVIEKDGKKQTINTDDHVQDFYLEYEKEFEDGIEYFIKNTFENEK